MSAETVTAGQDFIVPDLGEGLTEAEVVGWLVAVGDEVAIDQPVVELESAKSVVDLPCPFAGTVTALYAQVGDTVYAGNAILTVGGAASSGGGCASAPEARAGAAVASPPAAAGSEGTAHGDPGDVQGSTSAADASEGTGAVGSVATGQADSAGADSASVSAALGAPPASGVDAGAQAPEAVPGTALRDAAAGEGSAGGGSGAVLIGYGTKEKAAPSTGRRRSFGSRTAGTVSAQSAERGSASPAAAAAATAATAGQPGGCSPVVSPLVRMLAHEAGFTAKDLRGTGPHGLVTRADVIAEIARRAAAGTESHATVGTAQAPGATAPPAAEPSAAAAPPAGESVPSGAGSGQTGAAGAPADGDPLRASAAGRGAHSPAHARPHPQTDSRAAVERIPLTGLRKAVAAKLGQSRREIPEATIWLDVDATELLAFRRRLEARSGEKFSLLTLLARFTIAGLRKYPILNATFDQDAQEIVVHRDIDLGIAANTPRGLMVPAVRGAGSMTMRALRDGIGEVVQAAATGRFAPEQLSGGTFTLNNYGPLGVDGSAPIINHPEVAMLGMGRIMDRPWAVDGELAVRKVTHLSLVFDHRVCDGLEPSEFITFVARCIEDPIGFFAEV